MNFKIDAKLARTRMDWEVHAGDYLTPNLPCSVSKMLCDDCNILIALYQNEKCWTVLCDSGVVFCDEGSVGTVSYQQLRDAFSSSDKNKSCMDGILNSPDGNIWFPNAETYFLAYNLALYIVNHGD